MISWEKFDETSFPDKKSFYSNRYIEDITDGDYKHAERVWEYFKIKTKVWIPWSICSKWYFITF